MGGVAGRGGDRSRGDPRRAGGRQHVVAVLPRAGYVLCLPALAAEPEVRAARLGSRAAPRAAVAALPAFQVPAGGGVRPHLPPAASGSNQGAFAGFLPATGGADRAGSRSRAPDRRAARFSALPAVSRAARR